MDPDVSKDRGAFIFSSRVISPGTVYPAMQRHITEAGRRRPALPSHVPYQRGYVNPGSSRLLSQQCCAFVFKRCVFVSRIGLLRSVQYGRQPHRRNKGSFPGPAPAPAPRSRSPRGPGTAAGAGGVGGDREGTFISMVRLAATLH